MKPTLNGYQREWNPKHPLAFKDGTVLVHRKVAYDSGMEIPPGYQIHHKDGDKNNNDPSNLEVISNSEHQLRHRRTGTKITNQFGTFTVREPLKRQSQHKRNKALVRQCEFCSRNYDGKRIDAKFCSGSCRIRSWKGSQ